MVELHLAPVRRSMAAVSAVAALVGSALLTGSGSAQALENGTARTPTMGWNTFGCNISESLIRQTADALVKNGMAAAGYRYVVVGDFWFSPTGDAAGNLQGNPSRFPSGMKALGDYLHGRGLNGAQAIQSPWPGR